LKGAGQGLVADLVGGPVTLVPNGTQPVAVNLTLTEELIQSGRLGLTGTGGPLTIKDAQGNVVAGIALTAS
jgi:hypothetical protein